MAATTTGEISLKVSQNKLLPNTFLPNGSNIYTNIIPAIEQLIFINTQS
jgi:hypothetical protein